MFLSDSGKPHINQSDNNQAPSVSQNEGLDGTTQQEATDNSEISTQHNIKHRNNLAKLVAAVSEYAANNNGKLPSASDINSAFVSQYLNGEFNDPNTDTAYKIVENNHKSGEVQYKTSSSCSSNNTIIAGSSRQGAAVVLLSDSTYHCLTN